MLDIGVVGLVLSVAFANATLTNVAILLHDMEARRYPQSNLAQLILQEPIDLVVCRPAFLSPRSQSEVRERLTRAMCQ
jgi:hypothetical protein